MDNYWPDPLELIELEEVVTLRLTKATIGGKEFNIRYDETSFFVSPVEGFIPCGHFDYDHAFDDLKVNTDAG